MGNTTEWAAPGTPGSGHRQSRKSRPHLIFVQEGGHRATPAPPIDISNRGHPFLATGNTAGIEVAHASFADKALRK